MPTENENIDQSPSRHEIKPHPIDALASMLSGCLAVSIDLSIRYGANKEYNPAFSILATSSLMLLSYLASRSVREGYGNISSENEERIIELRLQTERLKEESADIQNRPANYLSIYKQFSISSLNYEIFNQIPSTEIPPDMICPITHEVMRDPVHMPDGHSYEREAMQDYYNKGGKFCPLNRDIPLVNPRNRPTDINLLKTISRFIKNMEVKYKMENQDMPSTNIEIPPSLSQIFPSAPATPFNFSPE